MLSFRSASDKHLTICGALLALFLLLIFGGVRVWLSAHESIDPLPPHLFEAFLGCEESSGRRGAAAAGGKIAQP